MKHMLPDAILWCAAQIVNAGERPEWLAEWRAELWHLCSSATSQRPVRFCLGAFRDALWLRRNASRAESRPWFQPLSAARWVLILAFAAAVSIFFAFRMNISLSLGATGSQTREYPVGSILAAIAMALLLLPIGTPFALGEYPVSRHSPPRSTRLRRWIYLGVKITLLVPIVFCGTADLTRLLSATAIQAHGLLIGYVLAIRWALNDQRQRCPVCLRVLTNPTRIGMASQMFLDWYGTELLCEKGHGLLHVPEIPSSSYTTQRWMYLDPSWSALFSKPEEAKSR